MLPLEVEDPGDSLSVLLSLRLSGEMSAGNPLASGNSNGGRMMAAPSPQLRTVGSWGVAAFVRHWTKYFVIFNLLALLVC
jgi:hypothetical protein